MEAVIYAKNDEEYKMFCDILEQEAELIDIYRDPADGFCHYEHEYDLVVVALEGAKGMNVVDSQCERYPETQPAADVTVTAEVAQSNVDGDILTGSIRQKGWHTDWWFWHYAHHQG